MTEGSPVPPQRFGITLDAVLLGRREVEGDSRTIMNMRSTIRPVRAVSVLLSVVLSSMTVIQSGSAAEAATRPAPSKPTTVRVEYIGGFVPVEYRYTSTPSLLLVAERLYLPGAVLAVYPGPAVLPLEERLLTRSSALARATAVYNAARTPAGGWGNPPVADAPTLEVTVTVNGRTRSVSVPAFGLDQVGTGVSSAQAVARQRLRQALESLEMVKGRTSMYRPRQLEAWVLDSAREGFIPGELEQADPLPWPAGVGTTAGCHVMAAGSLPKGANQASRFVSSTGPVEGFAAVFRPVLPGENACRRTLR